MRDVVVVVVVVLVVVVGVVRVVVVVVGNVIPNSKQLNCKQIGRQAVELPAVAGLGSQTGCL